MGFAKFEKLADTYKWGEAMDVCIAQEEERADVSDFNSGPDVIEGQSAVSRFMRMCVTEPTVARLPLMIDSSRRMSLWKV